MRIDILTIFPKMCTPIIEESIIKRARKKKKVKILVHDLRDYSFDAHRKVDDRPFGGGSGMVMKPQPIFEAVESLLRKGNVGRAEQRVVLLTPQGNRLTQKTIKRFRRYKQLVLICGHYEGIDERVRAHVADDEISIGDYILTGGELPAMVFVDCLVRLLPGVLGDRNSLKFESFEGNLLEYPHYTRPSVFRGLKVPALLLSGDHKKIEAWRKEQAMQRTKVKRPDLLKE